MLEVRMEKFVFTDKYAGIKAGTTVHPASIGVDHIAIHHCGGILYVPFGVVELYIDRKQWSFRGVTSGRMSGSKQNYAGISRK
jgi:hypothetical protein